MAVLKCKICGGDLVLEQDSFVAECAHCGRMQTVPSMDDDKKINQFARANRLRLANEFDKAAGIFESIVADYPEEAEAYWGLVLCRYGIEYVKDPATGEMVPTCHRTSFNSVMQDSDFEQTLENADPYARRIYREEAKQIEGLRKDIIAASANEQPYDIFICYKETGLNGQRTLDSVLAQDIYDALTDKGYRVFFARITLEDKLGAEYEPVIFAALNSARIMLAVGTDYEHFNAVWVKNEWGRYLKLMEKDREKHLIPCYKGIDANDMPPEFAKLQAQDLGKVGAMQDLLRGIEKILPKTVKQPAPVQAPAPAVREVTKDSLLERAYLLLEEGDFSKADTYFEKVLDRSPRESRAYWGSLLCKTCCVDNTDLTGSSEVDRVYNKCMKYKKQALTVSEEDLREGLKEIWGSAFKKACEFATGEERQIYVACFEAVVQKLLVKLEEQQDIERERQEKEAREARERKRKEEEARRQEKERKERQEREERERAAIKAKEKKRKKIIISIICVTLVIAIVYFAVILPNNNQIAALQLLKEANVGDYIVFGRYEQDNNPFNGKEDIEWLVLAKEGNRILVISRHTLDEPTLGMLSLDVGKTDWSGSNVRYWLNDKFMKEAFNTKEKDLILTVDVPPDENPEITYAYQGNATKDQVFLLSINEVNQYFPNNADRVANPTPYLLSKGNNLLGWGLRTNGLYSSSRTGVDEYGNINATYFQWSIVRPAIWIDLSAIED